MSYDNSMINNTERFTPEALIRDRGLWSEKDRRKDYFEIADENVHRNADATVSVWEKNDVIDLGNGFVELRVRPFKDVYNMKSGEPFFDQPVCAGFSCTGVLIDEDIVATSAHFIDRTVPLNKLCFVFGYVMEDPETAVTKIPLTDIYYGAKILANRLNTIGKNATGEDWILVQLDRKVKNRHIATISNRPVFIEQPVYAFGFPCGLPLKYSSGGKVESIDNYCFTTKLDLFSGNSGSPMFSAENHHLVGIVSACDPIDFKLENGLYVSMVYPNSVISSSGDRCSHTLGFFHYL